MLQEEGFEVEALAFERKYHKGRLPSCAVTRIGAIEHGKYAARLLKFIKALPLIRSAISRNDFVYASGQDMAFLGFLAGLGLGKPIVMEVGDLVNIQLLPNIKGKIFRIFDRWITRRYALLVVISEGFLNEYYRKWLGLNIPGLVIQNKLESNSLQRLPISIADEKQKDKPASEKPLRIGYFGLLRDLWSWQVLSTLAQQHPERYEIVLAGMPINPSNISELAEHFTNVKYIGEYRSPEGLPFIYQQIDMVWACYPEIKEDDWNLRWGRPNRFYESCFFKKPCFAREGSLFAEDVKSYNMGCLIRDVDVQKVVKQISSITYNEFKEWHEALLKLPQDVYLYEHEGHDLANEIRKLRPIEKRR
ncbi:hypothetical protein [Syntrophorhabdus aromaticivorans]|uniref:hypothetical protein n=1 Tax=Syntrophorhabdus aromaticivorans TaxID=328301 RepID=UPI0003F56F04|nr:hypothetical protein [Syntrophorhabdus aromaticivorans]